jgi:ABC-type transport system involved in multi-copper enzyme maturation permease subunit
MIRSAKSQLIALTNRRYLLGALGAAAFLAFVSVLLNVAAAGPVPDERGPIGTGLTTHQLVASDGLARAVAATITLVGIVALTLNAASVAADFSSGAIRNYLVRQPRRRNFIAGKVLALAVMTLALICTVALVSIATATAFAAGRGLSIDAWFTAPGFAALARATLNLSLAALGWGALGLTVAYLTRSAVTSIAFGVLVAIPLDVAVSTAWKASKSWLPGRILEAVAAGGNANASYVAALSVLGVALVACWTLSAQVFTHRDITA